MGSFGWGEIGLEYSLLIEIVPSKLCEFNKQDFFLEINDEGMERSSDNSVLDKRMEPWSDAVVW